MRASSSATRTGRRWPMSISRTSPGRTATNELALPLFALARRPCLPPTQCRCAGLRERKHQSPRRCSLRITSFLESSARRPSIARHVRADYALRIDMTKPKPKDQLQKRGRKTAFRPEYILIAKACARFGAIEDEIANELNIGPATLDRWKQKYPEFRCALKAGKDASDDRVERSLYQLAIGWNGNPPNTTAAIFWLKNRRPDRWRDVQQLQGGIGHYLISDRPLTEAEWIEQRTKMIESKPLDIAGAEQSEYNLDETST